MRPRQHLRDLATRIALVRGSPIETFGAADLLHRDAGGAWLRILEADQTVYLHPRTTRLRATGSKWAATHCQMSEEYPKS